ncbi:MAG: BrnT family toxin [Acidobacteriota bacterium]|nr:BrnT family toxin [Acidobacteriota bacterium]
MNFEWDDDKNEKNIRNHGIDFNDAWQIFDEPMLTEIDNRENYGEERFVGTGFLINFIVVIVFTEPKENTIRIISLRGALKYEREKFRKAITDRLGETGENERRRN